jgi:hypothetical protein
MRHHASLLAILSLAGTPSLLVPALSAGDRVPAEEIVGKVCMTRGGATFTFSRDGHYAYDGMWTDQGHYSARLGAITVLLDSGLERDILVSKRDGSLYLEKTAVRCVSAGEMSLTGIR